MRESHKLQIIDELNERVFEDDFDCLEDKLEALELIEEFKGCADITSCSLCYDGYIVDECLGDVVGKCGQCNGIGFKPRSS